MDTQSLLQNLPAEVELHGYRLVNVYQKTTPEIRQAIIDLWSRNRVLPRGADADARAQQVVLLAIKAESGQLVGVSTIYPETMAHIGRSDHDGTPYFFYRMFIQPDDRIPHLAVRMIYLTFELIRDLPMQHKPKGMIAVAENPRLADKTVQAAFLRAGSIIDGTDARGHIVYRRDF